MNTTQNTRSNTLQTNTQFVSTLLNPELLYTIQNWSIPGIRVEHQNTGTTVGMYVFQGETIEYSQLQLQIIVDEQLSVWKSIVNVFQSYQTNNCTPIEGESFVEVYDSKNKYLFKVVFHNSYLLSVSDLNYVSTDDNEIITVELTIMYSDYSIE
jgi:hypothetical protein